MANCAKCNAELNPAAKFCAGCGMPITTHAPLPPVNPFAATASPTSKNAIPPVDSAVIITNAETSKRASGMPPRDDTPSDGIESSPVSPLAVSGALSQRGAFHQAAASIKELHSVQPPSTASTPTPAPAAKKKPGTQVMQNAPNRPVPATLPEANVQPQPPTKKALRTMAMPNAPKFVVPGATGQAPTPNSVPPQAQAAPQPAQPPAAAPPVQAAPPWGWSGGAYVPGARVQVAWSNGQRYPATVSQVNGSHCLVVFPDGQQHWVETTYLSPG